VNSSFLEKRKKEEKKPDVRTKGYVGGSLGKVVKPCKNTKGEHRTGRAVSDWTAGESKNIDEPKAKADSSDGGA